MSSIDVMIILSFIYGNGSNSGHAPVYQYNGSSWIQAGQDLYGKTVSSGGSSVSLSSDVTIVAVGGTLATIRYNFFAGIVQVYVRY